MKEAPNMAVHRKLPGLIAHQAYIYVFGDGDVGKKTLQSCEKYTPQDKVWSAVGSMPYAKSSFTPFAHLSDTYLCGNSASHIVLDIYATSQYRTHPFRYQYQGYSSISYGCEGELVVLAGWDRVVRCKLAEGSAEEKGIFSL